MANVKITDLTAVASLTADDLLAIVDDPAGTPATKKATLQQILDLITAADVTNTPSGNLAATDVQAALNELQTDVDSRGVAHTHARPESASTVLFGVPGVNFSTLSTGSPGANLLNYEPFVVDRTITVDRLAIEVVSAAAASTVARLGIYTADTDWQPTGLVVDGGPVAVDSTGFKAATISQTLTPGLYLAAYHSDAAPTLRIMTGGPGGLVETLGAAAIINRLRVSKAYAALADPGTAWDTRAGATNGFHHFVAMRW